MKDRLDIMKGIGLFLILTILILPAYAQEVKFDDSWGKHGYSIENQTKSGIDINFSVRNFTIGETLIDGKSMQTVELPGYFLQNEEGAPNLPGGGRYIAIPEGAKANLVIADMRQVKYENVDLAPAPVIPLETEDGLIYSKNPKIYDRDAFYPAEPVRISNPSNIRGVDVVILGITPFRYNPVTKELIVFRDIKLTVEFEGGNGHFGDDRLRSRWWEPILEDNVLNYNALSKINFLEKIANSNTSKDEGFEYLIITPDGSDYTQWADSIRKFRIKQGILTGVVTLSEIGGNNNSLIESYINDAYNNWDIPPAAILLLGDHGTDGDINIKSPIYNSYCVSDNIYGDVDNDHLPDIAMARITANDASELDVMISKFMDYELNPPTNPEFYDHPITALGWQTERWFQICSETVGGFWREELGKDPVRINAVYGGNPNSDPWSTATNTSTVLNYFGPNGLGYIPASPSELGGWTGGNSSMVNNAINSGAFMLQHRDHGYESGWGEPAYSSSNINSLNNTDLTFVFSVNCLTGKYNWSNECFAEKFHRHTNGGQNAGALGIIAASEVSYSFVNDTYVWGMYDNMWPDFMPDFGSNPSPRGLRPAFGNSAGKHFLAQSAWPYNTNNKQVTYHLFHHHGDAFLNVYSEIPQDLTVQHDNVVLAGVDFFTVTADDGSLIALTVDDQIIGLAEGTGSPVDVAIDPQLPPTLVDITVTRQNYYRYTDQLMVIPPDGAYVIKDSYTINDENGNNNGQVEYGESILLSLGMKNVGNQDATNVVVDINNSEEYVTLSDNTENYGTIPANQSVTVDDGFAFETAGNILDGYQIMLDISATDGDSSWTSSAVITAYGPDLQIGGFTIDDQSGNNNGRLDPGETAEIAIASSNDGSVTAQEVMAELTAANPFITVQNNSYEIGSIDPGNTEYAAFTITAEAGTPVGTPVNLSFKLESGMYLVEDLVIVPVGLIVEDWETGDFSQFEWESGGSQDWNVVGSSAYEGNYAAQSGNIGDQQMTYLMLDYEVSSSDSISFYYKVSSEANYDYLQFFIDNQLVDEWSGSVNWTRAAYPVSAGQHTFKWVYDKDWSVSNGSDCGWVDFIVLPPPNVTTAFAGVDGATCGGDPYQLNGIATNYTSMEWSTSGDGTFDDNTIADPWYSPGTGDVASGEVTLTLTVTGPEETLSDDMILSIEEAPTAFAGDDDYICENDSYTLSAATAENCVEMIWSSSGDGTFDDPAVMNPVYTPGNADIDNGSVTLTLTGIGNSPCDDATDQLLLTIHAAPNGSAGEDATICSTDQFELSLAWAENYQTMLWETEGDGSFDDPNAMNPVYTPGSNDVMSGGTTLMMSVLGDEPCGDFQDEIVLSIVEAATAYAGETDTVCADGVYVLENATAQNYFSVNWTTSGDGSFDDPSAMNPEYTPGGGDINEGWVELSLTAQSNGSCEPAVHSMMLYIEDCSGIPGISGFGDVKIIPNPNQGNFEILTGQGDQNYELEIRNMMGALVYRLGSVSASNEGKIRVSAEMLEEGTYFVILKSSDKFIKGKLTVIK